MGESVTTLSVYIDGHHDAALDTVKFHADLRELVRSYVGSRSLIIAVEESTA